MSSFESKVTRLTDTGSPRFRVEFIGDNGESVAVECAPRFEGEEPSREEVVEEARRLARDVAEPDDRPAVSEPTRASDAGGLMRSLDEREARTHTSEGRDHGTE